MRAFALKMRIRIIALIGAPVVVWTFVQLHTAAIIMRRQSRPLNGWQSTRRRRFAAHPRRRCLSDALQSTLQSVLQGWYSSYYVRVDSRIYGDD
jgi:hypothetical protein